MTVKRTVALRRLMTLVPLLGGALTNPLAASAQPQGERPPTFYELVSDASSLQLIDLNGFDGTGAETTVVTIDLLRGKQKIGLRSKWSVDCTLSRMTIVEATQLAPGLEGQPTPMKPDYVSPDDSAKARLMFDLACKGEGDLQTRRTYFDDLPTIISRFWR